MNEPGKVDQGRNADHEECENQRNRRHDAPNVRRFQRSSELCSTAGSWCSPSATKSLNATRRESLGFADESACAVELIVGRVRTAANARRLELVGDRRDQPAPEAAPPMSRMCGHLMNRDAAVINSRDAASSQNNAVGFKSVYRARTRWRIQFQYALAMRKIRRIGARQ